KRKSFAWVRIRHANSESMKFAAKSLREDSIQQSKFDKNWRNPLPGGRRPLTYGLAPAGLVPFDLKTMTVPALLSIWAIRLDDSSVIRPRAASRANQSSACHVHDGQRPGAMPVVATQRLRANSSFALGVACLPGSRRIMIAQHRIGGTRGMQ